MIAEPGVLSTSPWNYDIPIFANSYLSSSEVPDFVPEIESRSGRGNFKQEGSSSCSPSSSSSECSDEHSLDFIFPSDNNAVQVPDHDYLNTSLNLLDDDDMTVCSPFYDWAITDSLISPGSFLSEDKGCEEAPSIFTVTSSPKQKRNNLVDPVADTKLWSQMTINEQLEAVESLTDIISTKLGLREQLDIIRVIEPDAVISSSDTEFIIDLNSLNDMKLCRVREYVRKVLASQGKSQGHIRSKTKSGLCSKSEKCSNSTSTVAKSSNAGTNPAKSKNVKKKEVKEKRIPQKVIKQRQKKEQRQMIKERRSGLFMREEVISLQTCPHIEEESEIDILG